MVKDREAWRAAVHGVTKSQTQLSDWTTATERAMKTSSAHGISQARILEWVAISFSRGSSRPMDWTRISCIGRWILYHCATREAPSLLISTACFFFPAYPWQDVYESHYLDTSHTAFCPSVTSLFHLVSCLQGLSMLSILQKVLPFLRLINIPLYECTIFSLSFHQFRDTKIIFTSWLFWIMFKMISCWSILKSIFIYLLIWPHLTAHGNPSSPTRDRTLAPCSGRVES